MTLQQHIAQAEQAYLNRFYGFCEAVFSQHHIPSHNHTHHLRVWGYVKQLLTCAAEQGYTFSAATVEGLLAASLFHDTGLTRNIGEQHGAEGAAIFAEYMAANPDIHLLLYNEIIEAITLHDDKRAQATGNAFGLTSILSACDNLDAFGSIGAHRYAEIYLMRGMPAEQLPAAIITNLDNRFAAFAQHYGQLHDFYVEQEQRYRETRAIYMDEKQAAELIGKVVEEITWSE